MSFIYLCLSVVQVTDVTPVDSAEAQAVVETLTSHFIGDDTDMLTKWIVHASA